MKRVRIYFLVSTFLFCFSAIYAQEPPKEKTPEQYAAMEAEKLEKELKLNAHQAFYVDSTLQSNFAGVMQEFENMKKSGMQDGRNYEAVRNKWTDKSLAAFKQIFTEQQYIQYLRMIGRGKEYKKGKDGLYYKKEDKNGKKE